jgi:hypothetical protein
MTIHSKVNALQLLGGAAGGRQALAELVLDVLVQRELRKALDEHLRGEVQEGRLEGLLEPSVDHLDAVRGLEVARRPDDVVRGAVHLAQVLGLLRISGLALGARLVALEHVADVPAARLLPAFALLQVRSHTRERAEEEAVPAEPHRVEGVLFEFLGEELVVGQVVVPPVSVRHREVGGGATGHPAGV